MRDVEISKHIDRVIALKLKAVDRLVDLLIEPIANIGNPEQVIGKKYEDWTAEDLQKLSRVYGTKEPNSLSEFIFKKSYDRVKKLEAEVN